jgi:nucleoside-diphosphate-sugar epimerase
MILVTGASGFVGQHVVAGLRKSLPTTRIRTFDARRPPASPPDGVEPFYGLIDEGPEGLHPVLDGVEVVIHLAAIVQPDAGDSTQMFRVNVEGTRNVYSAAVASGCRLFLHMSSAGIYGHAHGPDPFHEDDAPRPVTPYQRSKWQAEEALREIDSGDTTLNVMRPAGVYGPGSYLEIPQYRRIRGQRWAVEVRGGVVVHPTYIDDIVHAVSAIVERPARHGTALNIGGERAILLQDLQAMLAEVLGVSRHRLVLPPWLAGPMSVLGKPILSVRGRSNPHLGAMCRGALFSAAVDDSRLREGYPDVPIATLREGLVKSLEWATSQRLL